MSDVLLIIYLLGVIVAYAILIIGIKRNVKGLLGYTIIGIYYIILSLFSWILVIIYLPLFIDSVNNRIPIDSYKKFTKSNGTYKQDF